MVRVGLLVVTLYLLCCWTPAGGTPVDCGTMLSLDEGDDAFKWIDQGLYRIPGGWEGDPLYVRTAVHIVRTDEGTGGLELDQLAGALEKANEDFAPANIVLLRVDPIDYIDSDAFYYDINTTQEINQLRSTNPVDHAMNLYFTENLANENGSFCGISSFSWQPVQGVVMMNACTVTYWNPSTFSHEIGHYFDLLHTHETAYGAECVDGSNCSIAGDLICDTPADPRLNRCGPGGDEYCVDSYCSYTGEFVDPCHGDPYDPSTNNMMSYSRPLCRDRFTREQCERADATLLNIRPDHLIDAAGVAQNATGTIETERVVLGRPVPNPTAGRIAYRIALREYESVQVCVFDPTGRRVADLVNERLPAGTHDFTWVAGSDLPSGSYYLRLSSGGKQRSHHFTLTR